MRAFFPALVLCAVLSACGDEASTPATPAAEATASLAAPASPRLTLAELPPPYDAADLSSGEAAFDKCGGCHVIDQAQGHRVGPNLHGVFDRPPGTAKDFLYSDALRAMPLDRWTPAELDRWLADPRGYLPGSSMFFNGVDDAATRRDIIAYLMVESG